LLDDIRKGTRLRKVKKTEEDSSAPKKSLGKKAPPPSGGDMFTDLIQVLNRRRKGIANDKGAGKKNRNNDGDEEIKAPKETDGDSDDEEWK